MDPSPASESGERKAAAATRFPCPSCGAELNYDPGHHGLRCPFCGTERSVGDAGGAVVERDLLDALRLAKEERQAGPRQTRRLNCESCGATVEIAPTEKAGRCAYCGSSRIVEGEPDHTRIPPDSLIAFEVDAEGARSRFQKWIRSLWFRPNAIQSRTTLTEMRGVMVPYWTFDASADSSWTAQAGYYYYVTVGTGQNQRQERRVRWVPADGSRHDFYNDVLVCASKGLDEKLLDEIKPFKLSKLVPYRNEYLAGWTAESYAIDVQAGWARAKEFIRTSQHERCEGDVPGDTHRSLEVQTSVAGKSYKHSLLPVWIAAYRYHDKAYRFLINGQTGEVCGKAPFSWVKILLAVLVVLAVAGAVVLIARS